MTLAYVLSKSYVGMHAQHGHGPCLARAVSLIDTIRGRTVSGWAPAYTIGTATPPIGAVLVGGVANTKSGESDLALWVYPNSPEAMVLRDRCDQYDQGGCPDAQ